MVLIVVNAVTPGELVVYNVSSLNVCTIIKAHQGPVAALAISQCGSRLATASETVIPHAHISLGCVSLRNNCLFVYISLTQGTLIRVFALPSGDRLHSFRRGSQSAVITCLSFYSDPKPSISAEDDKPQPLGAPPVLPKLLCAASMFPTVHVFKLPDDVTSTTTGDSSGTVISQSGGGSGGGDTEWTDVPDISIPSGMTTCCVSMC